VEIIPRRVLLKQGSIINVDVEIKEDRINIGDWTGGKFNQIRLRRLQRK
jgi:hypothetical protein